MLDEEWPCSTALYGSMPLCLPVCLYSWVHIVMGRVYGVQSSANYIDRMACMAYNIIS